MVRAVTSRVLGAAGYTVIEAADGEEALAVIRSHVGPIDLLVSDVVMPNLGGLDLAKRVVGERPEIRILLVTGYNPEGMSLQDGDMRTVEFLHKPFTPSQLLTTVTTILARPATTSPSKTDGATSGDAASL